MRDKNPHCTDSDTFLFHSHIYLTVNINLYSRRHIFREEKKTINKKKKSYTKIEKNSLNKSVVKSDKTLLQLEPRKPSTLHTKRIHKRPNFFKYRDKCNMYKNRK